MRWGHRAVRWILIGTTLCVCTAAYAFPQLARETKAACASCHVNPAGGPALTAAGTSFKSDKKAPTGDAAAAEYVGVNKCKMCHASQYKVWQGSKHATAFATLQGSTPEKKAAVAAALKLELKGDASKDDNCVVCHVTGFQLPGGYPAADSAKTAAVMNVSCESCHGPGSKHVSAAMADKKKFINRSVGAAFCAQCHTAVTSPAFKFDEYYAKIAHPKAK